LAQAAGTAGSELAASEEFGLPAEAKEAAAFALLALADMASASRNVPTATGAKKAVILGQVTYA